MSPTMKAPLNKTHHDINVAGGGIELSNRESHARLPLPVSPSPSPSAQTHTQARTPHHHNPDDALPLAPDHSYPQGTRFLLVTIGLILSIFITALDSTIISTAIPRITSQFGSIHDIAWYGSSYAITNSAFQSPWGKAYQYFPLKHTFLAAIAVFELGNVVCASARSSRVLILGRIVAGMGGGGVMTGCFIMIALTAGPKYRAAYMGVAGVTFGCASVVGPLMGGALTDGPGWRWCFWISLPFALAAATMMTICFKSPLRPKEGTLRERLLHLDLNGAVLLSGSFSCFVLAMHWMGLQSWTGPKMVGSFVGFVGLLLCFVVNEWIMGKNAMVQVHLFKNKLVLANCCYIFFFAGAFFPLQYTLPVQFQSVNNESASQSGIRLIPLVLGVSVFTLISNGLLVFWRHYKPLILLGSLLAVVGNTKIFTSNEHTPFRDWIGYELVSAIGIGLALQIPMIANQNLVVADEMPAATSLTLFFENSGTALFIASTEGAFTTGLLSSLGRNLPHLDPKTVLDVGATQVRSIFSGADLEKVLQSYVHGLKNGHLLAVACGVVASLISLSNAGPAGIAWIQMRLKKSRTS